MMVAWQRGTVATRLAAQGVPQRLALIAQVRREVDKTTRDEALEMQAMIL